MSCCVNVYSTICIVCKNGKLPTTKNPQNNPIKIKIKLNNHGYVLSEL